MQEVASAQRKCRVKHKQIGECFSLLLECSSCFLSAIQQIKDTDCSFGVSLIVLLGLCNIKIPLPSNFRNVLFKHSTLMLRIEIFKLILLFHYFTIRQLFFRNLSQLVL